MTSERKRPHVRGRSRAAAAKQQVRRHFTPTDRLPVQLSLFGETTDPADGMYPPRVWAAAEWDLRFTMNTLPRGRSHWWIADQRRRSA
jgi:hypothetical protein